MKKIVFPILSTAVIAGFLLIGIGEDPGANRILYELRLPKLLLTLFAGGSLAFLGGTYQILFHNPLAEPYILGISSAIILGAAISEVFLHLPPHSLVSNLFGFVLALLSIGILVWIGKKRRGGGLERTILFGMGLNFVLSSTLFLLLSYSNGQMGSGTLRWLFGQVPWVSFQTAMIFALVASIFIGILLLFGRHLDAMGLGDSVSKTLGYDARKTRTFLLFLSSVFLSILVTFTGSVGFVGLVLPHAVRLIARPTNTRQLLSYSFLGGGIFLVFCDMLSRQLLPPMEFPIGIITTIIGGPVFLWLLWKR